MIIQATNCVVNIAHISPIFKHDSYRVTVALEALKSLGGPADFEKLYHRSGLNHSALLGGLAGAQELGYVICERGMYRLNGDVR